jgi:hypothetical protein
VAAVDQPLPPAALERVRQLLENPADPRRWGHLALEVVPGYGLTTIWVAPKLPRLPLPRK